MPDREKVIKGLECCCEHIKGMNCDHCPYDEEQIEIGQINQCTSALAYDALSLLKEQEAVVWCKDCKYAPGNKEGYTCKIRDILGMYMKNPDYFFCADGERKEGR